ncbi:MAG: hypothetical protein D6755_00250 [Anaerolineae bacterium]|nr:MAG: hypothetical protein D6755_00250 [Anaerolineae bacterium]
MFDYVVDVTDTNFDYEVIAYSQQEAPVIAHFWAEWCIPCRVVDKVLREMAEEARGEFRLARVDVDRNPKLARRFQVQSLPALRAFQQGQNVARLSGTLTEAQVREFVRTTLPDTSRLLLEKGFSLLKLDSPAGAQQAFEAYLQQHPNHPVALLGLGRALLYQGQGSAALKALRAVRADHPAYAQAQALLPLAEALTQARYADPLDSGTPQEAAYWRAAQLAQQGNFPAALDGLLDILRTDREYQQAHALILSIMALLGEDNPLTAQYRRELGLVLFS